MNNPVPGSSCVTHQHGRPMHALVRRNEEAAAKLGFALLCQNGQSERQQGLGTCWTLSDVVSPYLSSHPEPATRAGVLWGPRHCKSQSRQKPCRSIPHLHNSTPPPVMQRRQLSRLGVHGKPCLQHPR